MKDPIHIGESSGARFALPLEVVTQSIAVLAKRGVGKSYTAAVITEELLDADQQVVCIDPTGAAWGLKSSADGNSAGYKVVIFGGDHADLPLEETGGKVVARAIVEHRFSCVIDISLFRKGQSLRFLTDFLETLYLLNRLPLHLVCDEADYYAPQKVFGEDARTLGAMQDIVRRGRKKGIGCTLISQRPSVLNKDVLTQCEILVAMRLVHPRDIDAIEEWVAVHGDPKIAAKMIASLPSLPTGTAWIWSPGFGDIFEQVKIRHRKTFDSGATPKAGEVIRAPKRVAEVDLEKLGTEIAATVANAKANDPKELRARIAQLQAQISFPAKPQAVPTPVPVVQNVPVLTEDDRVLLRKLRDEASALSSAAGGLFNRSDILLHELTVKHDARLEELRTAHSPRALSRLANEITLGTPANVAPGLRHPGQIRDDFIANGNLPKGERAVLIACAQYPDGATREQLTVLTGYKRSSRDAYIQRLKERDYVVHSGDNIVATGPGIGALGTDYRALPIGKELYEYWMQRLPEGERKILEIVYRNHGAISRDQIEQESGYKRSSRDAYLQRLTSRKLVSFPKSGFVEPSPMLFG